MFVGWSLKTKELGNFGAESNEHFYSPAAVGAYHLANKGVIQRTSALRTRIQRTSNEHRTCHFLLLF